jgi:hypothetical protein
MTEPERPAYALPIADLERSAHVPLEQQSTAQDDPPPPPPISAEDFDRIRLLGVTGAGRL